ncbi:glycosyltransferase [uncultured Hoeflea sp.]|uniref:glycosyltransferase n=1 Tax=uncultured Hoeflea sp. TaxID=538666 RepID=UPI0030DBAF0F|tara:strand:+ start:243 stop:1256 length:1014 start_codon:yes stop_codon:yes gene_type:complete
MMGTVSSRLSEPRVSIAMATYNGVAYLGEQLASLQRQTRLPDELVVHDDASSDATAVLVRQIAARAPFNIRLVQGTRNLGVNSAFQSALARCTGDVIFFCDQDDIWHPEKIAASLAALENAPGAGFVFCDAVQFDSISGEPGMSLWQLARFTLRRRCAFRRDPLGVMLTGGNFVYGMAAAFRRASIEPFLPITSDAAGMTHDTWFALHAAALGVPGVALPRQLVHYRRHPAQTSLMAGGGVTADTQAIMRKAQTRAAGLIAGLRDVRRNVQREADKLGHDASGSLALFDRKIALLETRESLRRERSLGGALRGLVNPDYWRFASGPASVLRDQRGMW